MDDEKFIFIDETGDKEFFTIIPNYVLNHSTIYDRCLYIEIKRHAGENGECWLSTRKLAEITKMSQAQVRKSLSYLLKKEWIYKKGSKTVRGGQVNSYSVNNLWHQNSDFYRKKDNSSGEKSKKMSTSDVLKTSEHQEFTNKVSTRNQQSEHQVAPSNIHIERSKDMSKTSFDFFCELKKLLEDRKRHIQVIGVWLKENKLTFDNYAQEQSFIRRNCKPAVLLEGYSNEDIAETIDVLKHTDYIKKFTLETVGKYIDQVKAQKIKKGPRIIHFEEIIRDGHSVMRPIYEEVKKT